MENKEIVGTKKENLEKIKTTAEKITKGIKVVKILIIIAMVCCLIGGVTLCILAGTKAFDKVYEMNPTEFAKMTIDFHEDSWFNIKELEKTVTLGDLYNEGSLNYLGYFGALYCLAGLINLVVCLVVLFIINPTFKKIAEADSPFTEEMLKPFKIAFILITVLVLFQSIFVGLFLGAFLACIYFIIKYGINLQEEDDLTL